MFKGLEKSMITPSMASVTIFQKASNGLMAFDSSIQLLSPLKFASRRQNRSNWTSKPTLDRFDLRPIGIERLEAFGSTALELVESLVARISEQICESGKLSRISNAASRIEAAVQACTRAELSRRIWGTPIPAPGYGWTERNLRRY